MRLVTAALIWLGVLTALVHAGAADDLSLSNILSMQKSDPHTPETWDRYIQIQERMLERTRKKNPAIAIEAAARHERLLDAMSRRPAPSSADQPSNDPVVTGSLEAPSKPWDMALEEKSRSMDSAIHSARTGIEGARQALGKTFALAQQRQQKQEVTGAVVRIFSDLLRQLADRIEAGRKLLKNGKQDRLPEEDIPVQ